MQALRRDLRALEEDTLHFVATVEESNTWSSTQLQVLEGQFRFLWGIYQAHSDVRCLPRRNDPGCVGSRQPFVLNATLCYAVTRSVAFRGFKASPASSEL